MVAMVQRLDASGFFFHALLSVSGLLALLLKVFRNRFRCHGQSVAELLPFNLFNFVHSLTIHRPPRRDAILKRVCHPNVDELAWLSWFPVRLGLGATGTFPGRGRQEGIARSKAVSPQRTQRGLGRGSPELGFGFCLFSSWNGFVFTRLQLLSLGC